VTRNVKLQLDEFGQQSLDRFVARGEGTPTGALRTAALYYLGDRDAQRPAWRAPRFRTRAAPDPGLKVAFDDETWTALEEEARRQGVEPEDLAVHALLYFLADLDSGRLAELLGDALEDAPEDDK
jgi:hypothetical protein